MPNQLRRERILTILKESNIPISGKELAQSLGVSRQVIVQDIALLRANQYNILSTTKGYISPITAKVSRCFFVKHKVEDIEDELCTIIDHGGKVLDVIVIHNIYGRISTDLVLETRKDVYDFLEKRKVTKTSLLNELTGGVHYHTVEASSEKILDEIEQQLKEKNYLIIEK